MREHARDWLAAPDHAAEEARQRGLAAVEAIETAAAELGAAVAASAWLRGALDDDRFDRQLRARTVRGVDARVSDRDGRAHRREAEG
jgi:hypothetical protein